MRLVSFKRFELDLAALLERIKEKKIYKAQAKVDFEVTENSHRSILVADGDIAVVERVLIETNLKGVLTLVGLIRLAEIETNKYVVTFTAIYDNRFITFHFTTVINEVIGFHSADVTVTAVAQIQPATWLSVNTMLFCGLADIVRRYKNEIDISLNDDNNCFVAFFTDRHGEERATRVPFKFLSNLALIEGDHKNFKLNTDRAIRFMRYIARAEGLRTQTLLAEVSDI